MRLASRAQPAHHSQGSPLDSLARTLLQRQLRGLEQGQLKLIEESPVIFGNPSKAGEPTAELVIHQPSFYTRTVLGGSLGAAESYIDGEWDSPDLVAVIRLLVRNRSVLEGMEQGFARLLTPFRKGLHWLHRNSRSGSRKNIAAHYDLGNEFFDLFLDETLMYSCARFETGQDTLESASIRKLEGLCERLALGPADRVIEIGSGWGGFAIHAAKTRGCHVTTTTISEQQHQKARARIDALGLQDRITLLKSDYRDLEGSYDKLVSIEMIEAVGHQYFEAFFATCSRLLKPEGLMLLQAITLNDRHYLRARDEVDFIKRHVFPGSCIPAIGPLVDAAARVSDLQLIHLEDLAPHYAVTLRCWRERFTQQREKVLALGYSEAFIRLWTFYLAYCEGGYAERALGDLQMLFQKPLYRGAIPPDQFKAPPQ